MINSFSVRCNDISWNYNLRFCTTNSSSHNRSMDDNYRGTIYIKIIRFPCSLTFCLYCICKRESKRWRTSIVSCRVFATRDHGPIKINALFRIRSHLFSRQKFLLVICLYTRILIDGWRLARSINSCWFVFTIQLLSIMDFDYSFRLLLLVEKLTVLRVPFYLE